jgi:glutamine amidotransferase
MIVIIDYNINNVISIYNTVKKIERNVLITNNTEDIQKATKIILPGVGTYSEGMKNLNKLNLVEIIRKRVLNDKIPVLGICLGMQLLSTFGTEISKTKGLNLIEGDVILLKENNNFCLPHVGWNEIEILNEDKILKNISNRKDVYFVHSYHFLPKNKNNILSVTTYNENFVSIINKDNIYGFQFHPEKSGKIGMKLLRNFVEL